MQGPRSPPPCCSPTPHTRPVPCLLLAASPPSSCLSPGVLTEPLQAQKEGPGEVKFTATLYAEDSKGQACFVDDSVTEKGEVSLCRKLPAADQDQELCRVQANVPWAGSREEAGPGRPVGLLQGAERQATGLQIRVQRRNPDG